MKCFCNCLLPGMLLAGLLFFSGCGDSSPEPEKKTEPETEKKTAAEPIRKKNRKVIEDSEEGSLKIRYPNSEQNVKKPEVRDNQQNVSVLKKDDPAAALKPEKISRKELALRNSFRTKRVKGSFAEKLAPLNNGKIIRWSPQWHSDSIDGVRLPVVAVSPDRSIIIIAETLGEQQGPFGTRLVFLDTTNWTISAVHHLWKDDVRSIAISPNHTLVLVSRGQAAFKSPDKILLLDPWSGKIKTELPLPDVRRVYISKDNCLFAVFDRGSEKAKEITVYESLLKDPQNTKVRKLETASSSPILTFSPDGKHLGAAGDKELVIFRLSDWQIRANTPLPVDFITADLLLTSDGSAVAAPESRLQRMALMIRDGRVQEFGEKSHGLLFTSMQMPDKQFGHVLNRRGRISVTALSSLKEQQGVDPEEGRPRTVGDPRAVFPLPGNKAFAVLDEKGCFYLLYLDPSGKRWRKEILIKSTAAK